MPLEVPLEVPPVLTCIQIIQHSAMRLKINIALSLAAYCVSTCSLMLRVFCTTCGSTVSNKYYVYTFVHVLHSLFVITSGNKNGLGQALEYCYQAIN